jgi:hypothetical protein
MPLSMIASKPEHPARQRLRTSGRALRQRSRTALCLIVVLSLRRRFQGVDSEKLAALNAAASFPTGVPIKAKRDESETRLMWWNGPAIKSKH